LTHPDPPDPEVPPRAKRRRFTAQDKLRILREADRCKRPGEIGALLRRQGIYSSHLALWRKAREQGTLGQGMGRPRKERDPLEDRVKEQERIIARLQKKLERAELILDFQKKVAAVLQEEEAKEAAARASRSSES
jgi:transposase-like protein